MSTLTALARLEAAQTGCAQPLATVRHWHLSERPLVLIPLKLAGEAAAPLAVLAGTRAEDTTLLVVPQPRNRDLRFAFAAELAALVLAYIGSHEDATETLAKKNGEQWERCLDAPQILVPNPGGLAFLRLLGRSTRFRRTDGPYAVDPSVPLLGRWLTWFADRAEHPGSSVLSAMTSLLSAHWATGQSSLEDGNLAALLGWIDPPAGLTGPQASGRGEDPLVCPPAGPATDPGFDNEELAPLIAAYGRAISDEARARAVDRLRVAVRGQLAPTWELMWRSIDLLRAMRPGGSLAGRWERDREAFTWFAQGIPDGYPQARRDGAVAAARRLTTLERAQDNFEMQRALDDPLVMAERRLTGEAFGGAVVECDPLRTDTSGKRAVLRPHLRIRTADPLRVDVGDLVYNAGRRGQKGRVIEVHGDTVLLELSGGMGMKLTPSPGSVAVVGESVCFTTFTQEFQRPPTLPAHDELPWTHGDQPPQQYVPTTEDAQEDWS